MKWKPKTNRRDFLKGKSAVDALANLQPDAEQTDDAATGKAIPGRGGLVQRDYLVQVERKAMACHFQIFLNAGQQHLAIETALDALNLVDVLEAQMSIYRPDSEICTINHLAAGQTAVVEPRLFHLLERCLELNRQTGGAFDITASPLVALWGFRDRKGHLPKPEQIEQTMQRVGSQQIVLDAQQRTISFQRADMDLNLGSIGKGYALDRCAELLDAGQVNDYIIHGGQSSIVARGTRAGRGKAGGWMVALPHPLRPEKRLAEIQVNDRSVGTSGSGRQFFYHHGRRYGHVLDPRTGQPAEGILSATVLANSAADADALATAFFVMGIEATQEYCERHPDLSVIFVCPGQRRSSISIETINVDERVRFLDDSNGTVA